MNIERISESSSASKDTHTHRGYERAFRFVNEVIWFDEKVHQDTDQRYDTLDLFARTCPWADFRNDLNPEFKVRGLTNMCMDALEACKTFKQNSIKIVFFDPPFSPSMAESKYEEFGSANLYTNPKYISQIGSEMFRILEPGGFIIKAGFNSNPPDPRLSLEAMYVSHYHACRNDVIFTVWKKNQRSLNEFY